VIDSGTAALRPFLKMKGNELFSAVRSMARSSRGLAGWFEVDDVICSFRIKLTSGSPKLWRTG
jgi:hypothetical protein